MKMDDIREVGAFTVIQPWGEIILHKGKNVENRQKNCHYRGTVAIHASSTKSKGWFEECPIKVDPNDVEYGSIIGFANLVDVITKKNVTAKTKKWFFGDYGLVLENVITLKKPVKVKGARGLWRLRGKVLKDCLVQLKPSQIRNFVEFKKVKSVKKAPPPRKKAKR